MTQRRFVHYDPSTGRIWGATSEHETHFKARQARGEPIVEVSGPGIDIRTHEVDLATRTIRPKEGK